MEDKLNQDDLDIQQFFGSIGTDIIGNENSASLFFGLLSDSRAKKIARLLQREVPNLINTDVFSLALMCNIISDLSYIDEKIKECKEADNLMVYSKLYKMRLDGIAKVMDILRDYRLTPATRKKIKVIFGTEEY
ncbi:hypothetical protein [Clostridium butyricum]